jgi:hypothetical protein
MTKHKPGESKAERKVRRALEHNKKMITEHFHLNHDKYIEEKMKLMGEGFRSISARFSDKEIEEAMGIGFVILNSIKPEDGYTYAEIAMILWAPREHHRLEDLPEQYLKDNVFVSKIDHLLYVLQIIAFESTFNTTMEPQEEGKRGVSIIPHVKSMKLERYGNRNVPMIFNAAASKQYTAEALEKFGWWRPGGPPQIKA